MLVELTIALSAVTAVLAQFSVEVLQAPTGRGLRHPVDRCEATGANFGVDVATFSFSAHAIGCGIYVSPEDACAPVTFNPKINGTSSCTNYFAIVPRGKCNFSEKAFHVQRSGPSTLTAIIIYNEKGKLPVDMNGGKYADQVTIPVLMVSYDCMLSIMHYHPASEGYLVQIKISPGYYDLFRYLIPFVVVVGFCFLVLLISLAIRLCRERRRIARKRLSKRNLKKIPTKKYRKGDHPETCAICLEDFLENEKLRVLPCRHTYHTGCIDPWLTQNRKVCPMCKRRVGAKNSDSESSDDERSRRQQEQPSTSSAPPPPRPSTPLHVTQTDETTQSYDASPPEPSITSNVMVEVHRNSAMGGSREQLVDEDFLSDLDHLSDDEEAETSLSQSLKKKIKGLFNRSGNEPLRDDQDFGRLNTGFQGSSHSVAEQQAAAEHLVPQQELEEDPYHHHGAEAEYDSDVRPTTPAGNQENSACVPGYQFRDPFETHDEAPTTTSTPSGPATNEDPSQTKKPAS